MRWAIVADAMPQNVKVIHPYAWLWEPLENEPTFVLRAMFGTKAAYVGGRLMLCFTARHEPWRGVLVCTDRPHHASLVGEFPALKPHPILPKWLYLPEEDDGFERAAERLVRLARQRDPRIGIEPKRESENRRPRRARDVSSRSRPVRSPRRPRSQ